MELSGGKGWEGAFATRTKPMRQPGRCPRRDRGLNPDAKNATGQVTLAIFRIAATISVGSIRTV